MIINSSLFFLPFHFIISFFIYLDAVSWICSKGKFRGGFTAKIENEEIQMKQQSSSSVSTTAPDIELKFARSSDKRIYVTNIASKKEPTNFFPDLGSCETKDSGGSQSSSCQAATASKRTCLAILIPGTQNSACVYKNPVNGGKIRLLPKEIPTVPVSLSSVSVGGVTVPVDDEDKLYRFDDNAMFLEVGDKFKINRPQCSNSLFTTQIACENKGTYKDICMDNIDSGNTGKLFNNGRQTDKESCAGTRCAGSTACREVDNPTAVTCANAGACTFTPLAAVRPSWHATGKCYKAKAVDETVFSVPLEGGREDRKVDCESAVGTWTPATTGGAAASCSNGIYTSEESCTNVGTWIYCTDTRYTSEAACTRIGQWQPGYVVTLLCTRSILNPSNCFFCFCFCFFF